MRSRLNVLGLRVQDCEGREVGDVVGTWPEDGGWEIDLVVVRLPRFGERRMLPADELTVEGDVATTAYRRVQVLDAPELGGYDDADRARAYWLFEEPGMLTPQWRRRSGSSATGKPSLTTPRPTTPTAS